MDSPSFPSVETHSSKDTQDGRHRAGPRRNHKIDKVIAQLRTKRVHARSELIEFLAINGFNVRDVNCKKRTRWGLGYTYPLHMAAAQDRPRIVSLLLQCGADAMAKDSSGRKAEENLGLAFRRPFLLVWVQLVSGSGIFSRVKKFLLLFCRFYHPLRLQSRSFSLTVLNCPSSSCSHQAPLSDFCKGGILNLLVSGIVGFDGTR